MTCPSEFDESNVICEECIFSLICKEDSEYELHQFFQKNQSAQ